jgi:F-box/leucine-rich repeat protein 4
LDLFRSGIQTDALLNILKNNKNLKHLNLKFSTEALNLDDVCQQLKTYNRQLVSLDLWKSHSLTPIGITALSELRDLEEVDFGWCLRETVEPSDSLKLLVQNCGKLRKLFLAAIRGITDRDLENIAKFCANLEQLDMMGIPTISADACLK